MWAAWVIGGLLAWTGIGLLVALLVGRAVRVAEERSSATGEYFEPAVQSRAGHAGARRRALPLPPIGIALAAMAVGLQALGYGLALSGARGPLSRALSMDAAFSLPRLYVAGLFAVAAVAAVAGAGRQDGRRGWWLGVAVVATGIAAVKAGSTLHAGAVSAVASATSSAVVLLISVVLAAAFVLGLWSLSRHERRDRRRVLGSLTLYAVAAVGLSALSGAAAGTWGAGERLVLALTFLEESGEALAGVVFLLAVVAGVAPRLVLPAEWALRRATDADALSEVSARRALGEAGH